MDAINGDEPGITRVEGGDIVNVNLVDAMVPWIAVEFPAYANEDGKAGDTWK